MVFLGVEKTALERIASASDSTIVNPTNTERTEIPCYIWNCGSDKEFSAFLKIVEKLKITEDIKNIELLFKRPTKNLAIRMDEQQPDYVLQIFAYFKDVKFFLTNGCGFYQVLQCHVFNFDKVFLKGRPVQRRVDKVKKKNSWKLTKTTLEKEFMSIHKAVA
jgi:hypothetical protein